MQTISVFLYCYHQTRGNTLGPIQAFKLCVLHSFVLNQKTAFHIKPWTLFLKSSFTGKETWHWRWSIIILRRKLRKIKYFKAKPETQEHKNLTAYQKTTKADKNQKNKSKYTKDLKYLHRYDFGFNKKYPNVLNNFSKTKKH